MVDLFLDSYHKLLSEIREAIARRDINMLERAAHTFKGSVSNFSAHKAFELALKLENTLMMPIVIPDIAREKSVTKDTILNIIVSVKSLHNIH